MVTVITAGNTHDGAGSIPHQHIFCNPYRNLFSGKWMNSIATRETTADFFLCLSFPVTPALYISEVVINRGLTLRGSQGINERMLRRYDHKINTIDGIGSGGIDCQRFFNCFSSSV